MNSLFDKLNLRPQERRLVVIVAIVVFVVLNLWLVIPMFGDYGKYQQRILDSETKLKGYQDEINKRDAYQKDLNELKKGGSYVPTEEAALRLSQEVNSQAALSGVTITSITPLTRQTTTGKTNAFFEEAAVTVNVNTGEKELIDFLFRLADKETLVRAKSMNISTDPSRMRLQGQVTLVKSFQRRPPPKVTAAVTAAPKPPPSGPPASSKSEPTAKPPSKPATPTTAAPVVTPAAPKATSAPPAALSGTNRVRRMPAPVKP
jgi:hypothetical protein